jgi:hypothetical protein
VLKPIDAAKGLAAHGFCVLPAPYQKKAPAVPWKQYQDPEQRPANGQLEELFGGRALSNYWLLMGQTSRAVCADCDNKATIEWLYELVGAEVLDATPQVRTHKGRHFYFRIEPGEAVESWSLHDGDIQLDFRAEGGGVIAPPSMHERGDAYQWVRSPDEGWQPLPDVLRSRPAAAEPTTKGMTPSASAPIAEGSRSTTLTSLAGTMRRRGMTPEAITAALLVENERCVPPLPPRDVEKIATSVSRYEPERPAGARLVRMSDVQPEQVRWLWPSRVPLGKLTLLMGDPGLMKSTLTLFMAAQVTNGGAWPDCVALAGDANAPQGDVVLLTAEDGLADTVRPRLDELGADVARVWVLEAVAEPKEGGERSFNIRNDIPQLERVVMEKQAKLVVVDPLNAYTSGTDSHKAAEVRQAMSPLAAMAERCGVAVVLVHHLNKGNDDVNALYRASGSLDYVAVARSVLGVAPDPDEEGRILLVPVKLNIAAKPEGLGFRRGEEGLVFDGKRVTCSAQSAFSAKPKSDGPEMKKAKEFLSAALADGARLGREVYAEAEEAGITEETLKRSKKRLNVKSIRPGGAGPWIWMLEAPE